MILRETWTILKLVPGGFGCSGGAMVETPLMATAPGGTHATSMHSCYSRCVPKVPSVYLEYRGVGIMGSCPWCTLCFQRCSFPDSLFLVGCVFTGCNKVLAKVILLHLFLILFGGGGEVSASVNSGI